MKLIYFLEIIITIIAITGGFIIYGIKHKKGYFMFLTVSVVMCAIAIGATYILERPQMEIKPTTYIEVNTTRIIEIPKTTYHFKDVTENVRVFENVNRQKIGDYKVKYELDTLIGTYSAESNIKVVDTKAPNITLEGEENYYISYLGDFKEPGYSAIDEYDGDLTGSVKVTKVEIDDNRFDIKYEVSDLSGNVAVKTRIITRVDDVPPVLTLNGSEEEHVYLYDDYEEKGAKANDEKEKDLTDKIIISGNVDTSKEGTYIVTYKVVDHDGNEVKKERKVIVEKQPLSSLQEQAQNGSNGGKKGEIYLTFNGGPSTQTTQKILDILSEKNVEATFFISNYDLQKEKIVKREYEDGHTVAMLGDSDKYNEIYKSEEAYMESLTKLQEKIEHSIGYKPTIMRFIEGSSNNVSKFNKGIMTRLTKLVLEKGYRYFDWNISAGDEESNATSKNIYNNVVSELSKSKQNVILMHDTSDTKLLEALGDIIDYGLQNGYKFSKITETTPLVTHKVNN